MAENYQLRDLGEVATITSGFAFSSEFFSDSGGIPLVRNRDVSRGFSKTFYSGPYSNEFVVQDNDLLVSMDGGFRVGLWRGGEALLNQRVARITPDSSVLDKTFLRFLLPRELTRIEDATAFATVKHLSAKSIAGIPIFLPSIAEQRHIAAALEEADSMRQRRAESLQLLDAFLSAAFLEIFGDPMRNEGRLDVVRLEDVADIVSGITKGRKISRGDTSSVPYMRVANVQDGYLALDDIRVIEATGPEVVRYCLERGDILLTEGGDPDKLGRGAVWQGEIDNCIHQNHVFRVRITDARLTPDYVSALLGSSYGKRYFLKAAKQTTGIASINRTQLGRFPTLVPPVEQQHLYSSLVRSSKRLEAQFGEAAEHAEQLFTSISQKAFRDSQ